MLFGVLRIGLAWSASAVALLVHFGLFFGGARLFPESPLTFANPGVTASIAGRENGA